MDMKTNSNDPVFHSVEHGDILPNGMHVETLLRITKMQTEVLMACQRHREMISWHVKACANDVHARRRWEIERDHHDILVRAITEALTKE